MKSTVEIEKIVSSRKPHISRVVLVLLANLVFLLHVFVLVIVFWGWIIPTIWPFYMIVLLGVLLSDILFGYCILSKVEFSLRKMLNPALSYEYAFSSYYTHKLTEHRLSNSFIMYCMYGFISISLLINLWFHFQ